MSSADRDNFRGGDIGGMMMVVVYGEGGYWRVRIRLKLASIVPI